MAANRLSSGGRIDRSKPIDFTFNGKNYAGFVGDTLASALLANGVSIVGRSFKLHRPRGIVGCGSEEPNAIMQIGVGAQTEPNPRATQIELVQGLEATSTKGWPGLRLDVGEIGDLLGRVFSAGFYYKTFMYPRFMWRLYERFIRRSAGFGKVPAESDPDQYEHSNAHCDVLVVGAGPAGLMAALAAAKSGASVMLVDEQNEPGGRLLSSSEAIDSRPASDWIAAMRAQLEQFEDFNLLTRSTTFGYYDHNYVTIAERCREFPGSTSQVRQRLWKVRAKQVVLAQGAFERPLVFCNNDRPGVMLASAVSSYVIRYAVCPGRRVVIFTNNDSAYQTALDLAQRGIQVAAVIDSRIGGADGALSAILDAEGIPMMLGHIVCDVIGRHRVSGVKVARWQGDANEIVDGDTQIACDLLAMSGGWSPAIHLHSQSGGKSHWDSELSCFLPDEHSQLNCSAGAGRGKWSLSACLMDGLSSGLEAAVRCGFESPDIGVPTSVDHQENPIESLWRVPATQDIDQCAKQFLDFQNDTSVADVRQAVREGYQNVEHVKRYTALGFGTDQGKLGNINGMAVLAMALGEPIENIGTTTFRPCYTPTTFGAIAGDGVKQLFDPVRKTPIHDWHEAVNAPMEVVGQWLRPWYFPRNDEPQHKSVSRECLAVRNSVGVMDASTLGKIDVRGPDAVKFLDRIYTHNVAKMKVGRCAYGITLGEDGMVRDDGVMARLEDQHFYLTTTTGGAASAMTWLELWLQTEWPELEVYLTSVTDHYSTIAVAGPKSRRVLQNLGCDIDLEASSFPFMTVRKAQLGGWAVQIFRVSFSGELAFEINIDSRFALAMWEKVMSAGEEFGITPYGTESMHVLRAEKGFVIVGQETDGSVTPMDLKMNWLLAKDKDFLGKRSLARPDSARPDRKQLVGLLSADEQTVLQEGMQLLLDEPPGSVSSPVPMAGHVTSAYHSSFLGHPIALGLLEAGHKRSGETVYARASDGTTVPVTVGSSVFVDPKGERQNV